DLMGVVSAPVFQSQALGGPAGERIGPGGYDITVTNTVNLCPTNGTVTLQQNTVPVEVMTATATPLTDCVAPDGTVAVGIVNVDGAGAALGDFTFGWTGPGAPFAGANGANLINGDYFVTATKTAITAPASGCASSPFRVTVLDDRRYPTISFATLGSTACNNEFDGEITVTSTTTGFGAGTTYNFVWTSNPGGAVQITDQMGVVSAPVFQSEVLGGPIGERIGPGNYNITVTNNVNQCPTDATVSLQQNTVPIEILTATANPQQRCTIPGDGSVAVALVNVRVGGNPVLGGITLAWEDNGGAPVGAGTSVLNLNAGFYTVEATRTSGLTPASGCVSAPLQVEVIDDREFPLVTFSTIANTTCNTNFDAQITVMSTTTGLGNGSNYDLDWTSDPGGAVVIADAADVASPYSTAAPDNIGIGSYTLTVTNRTTQCPTTASVTVLQNTTPVQIWDVTKIDQSDCAPFDGNITIDTNDPAHVSVLGPYTFVWDKAGVPLAPVPDNIVSAADAGVYTVTGTKTSGVGAGCITAPFSVTLLDLTQRPTIELQAQANFACDPALANGQISSVIFVGPNPVPAADYAFQWFAGKNNTTPPVIGISDVLSNQVQGDYTLHVIDNVSPNRGCDNTATLAIVFDETSFSLAVAAADQNLCAPGQNGSVSVTGLTEVRNGVSTPAGNLALYDYQWFDQTGTPHPSTPAYTNAVTAINNLLAGSYHVQVRNAVGCISTATAGVVNDLTVLPVISLDNFLNPAVCILPETSGFLQVSADNSLNFSDYIFEWYEGPDTSGTLVEPNNATLPNIQYNQPLQYTVRVTNIATNCVNLDTYRFSVDTVEVHVVASAVARTNCLVDDGSLFATTLEGTGALYNYEWYSGPVATGAPVFTTKDVTGAPMGQYTVIAINPNHNFCVSTPYTTRITDARVTPAVVATQKNPLTYCDPANPNGVAFATVNNGVSGFTFDWFAGIVGGAPLYTGSEITGLTAITYVVRATDVLSGCENTASIAIDNDPVDVVEPTVTILSHLTNCVVPDGALSANVDGNTADYFVQWYDGNSVKNQNNETGEFYRDIDQGFYTVTATDNESGCVSNPVISEILPFQETPEFDIKVVPTNCEQNIGEATLVLLNDVELLTIEWDIAGVMEFGTMISGLPKGEFTVTATTYQQCVTSKTFLIDPEILVFNGISANNDGQNDIFEIACIQDFPKNNVKIFNRAGTLVYEANGYDNQDVFFDGISNRGINLLGTDLPDGTYFYIIDKRNGSQARTGYLELLKQ
ncbi:MAG: gliding motility-associated C-terminal domain-containing protein, partial [Cyclobacteriaceae bacterium]